jgi:hypothetical protein
MKKIKVDILSNEINSVVLQLPDRKYPGVVIQGDSLSIIYGLVEDISNNINLDQNHEVTELIDELKDLLGNYVNIYEETLKINNIDLPY